MKSTLLLNLVLSSSILFVSCSSHHKEPTEKPSPKTAEAQIKSVKMPGLSGVATFEQKDDGLYMTAHVSGMKPNAQFGFHIHEKGKCEGPGYQSAGDHLNPYHHQHSAPEKTERHLGDLGNLMSDNKGHAMKELFISGDVKDLDIIVGKAMIIHAKPDDLKTQPSGNSGDRIACGLIEMTKKE